MQKRLERPMPEIIPGAMTTATLCAYLECGRPNAIAFGEAAGARIQIGRSVRWSRAKIDDAIERGLVVDPKNRPYITEYPAKEMVEDARRDAEVYVKILAREFAEGSV